MSKPKSKTIDRIQAMLGGFNPEFLRKIERCLDKHPDELESEIQPPRGKGARVVCVMLACPDEFDNLYVSGDYALTASEIERVRNTLRALMAPYEQHRIAEKRKAVAS